MPPIVSHITIYPVKSLDGISVDVAEIGNHSYLVNDRRFAIFGEDDKLINGKSEPKVHLLRLRRKDDACLECESVLLNETFTFDTTGHTTSFAMFLSRHFGKPVEVREDQEGNFQDVPHDAALTVVSTASLQQIGAWMKIDDLDELRARFRATIEISGVPAFWEDRLFGKPGEVVPFRIGDVELEGIGPRERCVVPTRHPSTSAVYQGFAKEMAASRWNHVPDYSVLHEWGHGYFLSVDCRIAKASFLKRIRLNDLLTL